MTYSWENIWNTLECSPLHPCNECEDCKKYNNGIPIEGPDQEITLYETSLGYEPFKE